MYHLLQADAIYNMVGYPQFIMDAAKLDKVFNEVDKRFDNCTVYICHSYTAVHVTHMNNKIY